MNNKDLQKIIAFMKTLGYEINPAMEKYYSFKIVVNNCKETSYYFRKKQAIKERRGISMKLKNSPWFILLGIIIINFQLGFSISMMDSLGYKFLPILVFLFVNAIGIGFFIFGSIFIYEKNRDLFVKGELDDE